MSTLTLLFTGDLHHRLRPELAERLRALKEKEANVLLLDAGDAIRAGNLGITPWGERVLAWMHQAGYDAMAVGNRETHLWEWTARAKVGRAPFPLLCANVTGPGVGEGSWEAMAPGNLPSVCQDGLLYRSHVIVRLPNRLRVALFGLTVPMVRDESAWRWLSAYRFTDPIQAARRFIPRLASHADLVVALSHLGLGADRELAHRVEGIHVIVGGHCHTRTEAPVWVNGTAILHAGYHARYVARAEIELGKQAISVRLTWIPLRRVRERRRPRSC